MSRSYTISKKSKKAEQELRKTTKFVASKGAVGEPVLGTNWELDKEDAKILPDSEYPDWLWRVLDPKPTLEEMSTDDPKYWKLKRQMEMKAKRLGD